MDHKQEENPNLSNNSFEEIDIEVEEMLLEEDLNDDEGQEAEDDEEA